METLRQDLRYGVHMLLKNPGFTAVAVFSLALGIGANSTIFSVINALLFRPLPFKDSHQLVLVWEKVGSQRQQAERRNPRFATFSEWRAQSQSFQQMELSSLGSDLVTLAGVEEAGQVRVAYVGRNLFQLLGVKPVLGRSFLEDDATNHVSAAVIGHGLWQSRFSGGNDVLGRKLTVDGSIYTVIGVMPPGFWVVPWDNTMRQEFPGVLLLQFDQARVKKREALGPADSVVVLDTISGLVGTAYIEVEIEINAALLQFGNKEIQPIELLRVELAAIFSGSVDKPAGRGQVEEMKTNAIHAEPSQRCGPHRCVFLGRDHHRTLAPVSEVDSPKPDALAIGLDKMAAPHADEAILAGGSLQEKRDVNKGVRSLAMVHREGLQRLFTLSKRN